MAQGIVNRVVPSSAFCTRRCAFDRAQYVSDLDSLHFFLRTRFTTRNDHATNRRDEVAAVNFTIRNSNALGNVVLENSDSVVAVVPYARLPFSRLNKNVSAAGAFSAKDFYRSFGHFNHDEMLPVYYWSYSHSLLAAMRFRRQPVCKIKKERPAFAYAYPNFVDAVAGRVDVFQFCDHQIARHGWKCY